MTERREPTVVPTLDIIAADPSRVRGLPASVVIDLLRRTDLVRAELHSEVLRLELRDTSAPSNHDRVLGIEDAAAMLGMSKDFLYRNRLKLGLGFKDADGRIKFRILQLQRYLATRG